MSRRFVKGTVETVRRRLDVQRVIVPLRVVGPGGVFAPQIDFQWDTGSELSVMSEAVARDHGIPLDDQTEETTLVGVTGGEAAAWLVPRFVRFPGLDGLRFRFHFVVHKGSADPLPLLGMRDTYLNLEVHSRRDEVYFFLKRDHTGEPV